MGKSFQQTVCRADEAVGLSSRIKGLTRVLGGILFFALLYIPAQAAQSVTLAWDPSPDPNVAGYNMYYGSASLTYTNLADAGNVTNRTISGLIDGRTYYFAATAYNTLGIESVFSNELIFLNETNLTVPMSIGGVVRYYPAVYPLGSPSAMTVGDTTINLSGDTNRSTLTLSDGSFNLAGIAGGGTYGVSPGKTNDSSPANGVNSTDLVLIRRHILGTTLFNSPYRLLAADVNGSGAVNSTDLVLIRRLILGTSNTFPAGLWRHVPAEFVFPDAGNPWSAPTDLWHTNLASNVGVEDFVAIKLGDVNESWTMPVGQSGVASSTDGVKAASLLPEVLFRAGNHTVRAGDTMTVPISVNQFGRVTSAQFSLIWDPAVLDYVGLGNYGPKGLSVGNFGIARTRQGELAFAWDDPQAAGVTLPDSTAIFCVTFDVIGKTGSASTLAFGDSPTTRHVGINAEVATFHGQNGLISVFDPGPPTLSDIALLNGGFQLSVPTVTGRRYVLEFTDELPGTNWIALPAVEGDGTILHLVDPGATNHQRFYRVRIVG